MKVSQRICILGGCGAMGRVIVTCLLRLDPKIRVTIADRRSPPERLPLRVRFQKVDLRNHAGLVRTLRGHLLVINSTSHHFNLPVMKAALDAKVHYLDLGGLFHFTRRQLKWDVAFRRKGRVAILGMGCAPGIANLLARWAAEGMSRVDEIHIKVGGQSWGPPSEEIPYAVGTIREELTLKPAIYHEGKWKFEPPRSGVEWFQFPPPVGRQKIFRTLHSEVATLPISFAGVREASFKIGFSDEIIRAVLKPQSPPPDSPPKLQSLLIRDCEITLARVKGLLDGRRVLREAWCTVRSSGNRSAGDWDTAWPPAIVAQMIAQGKIQASGVFPPEKIVPLELFLQRLKRIGFKLSRRTYRYL